MIAFELLVRTAWNLEGLSALWGRYPAVAFAQSTKMPIADGEDLNYPMLCYLIKLSLFAGLFLYF